MNIAATVRTVALATLAWLAASAANAACSSPTGQAGDIKYAGNYSVMVFCDGTNWVSMASSASGGGSATPAGSTADIQYNNAGALAADTGLFTYTSATGTLRAAIVSTTNTLYTPQVSLTAAGVTWGYLNSTASFLPTLNSNLVSASTVSATYVSVTTGYFNGTNVTSAMGVSGTYIASGTTSVSTSSAGTIKFGTGGSMRMFVDSSGNIGLRNTAVNNFNIRLTGEVGLDGGFLSLGNLNSYGNNLCYSNASQYTTGYFTVGACSSDQRLKTDFHAVDPKEGLAMIDKITPTRFKWKSDLKRERLGFIAQDVQKAIPEAVSKNSDGYLGFDNNAVLSVSVAAIKQLKADNESANENIALLRAQVDALMKQVQELQQQRKAN